MEVVHFPAKTRRKKMERVFFLRPRVNIIIDHGDANATRIALVVYCENSIRDEGFPLLGLFAVQYVHGFIFCF